MLARLTDAKPQTIEESQRRVTAEAKTADKLGSFNQLQSSRTYPTCPGDDDFRLIRPAAERNIPQTNRSQQVTPSA
jgi:hypothetical protein